MQIRSNGGIPSGLLRRAAASGAGELVGHKLRVEPASGEQLGMRTRFNYTPLVKRNDQVSIAHC